MLRDLSSNRIYFCNQSADMRKGFNGLSGLINGISGSRLMSGDIFCFYKQEQRYVEVIAMG